MFVGVTLKPVLEQITRIVSFENWRQVFVGCSGSFRFERALEAFPLTFTNRLAFIEKRVAAGAARRPPGRGWGGVDIYRSPRVDRCQVFCVLPRK